MTQNMTLSIMALCIMTFSITTVSKITPY